VIFRKKREKAERAFGKIPAYCRYELHMERYRSAADFVRRAHEERDRLRLLDVGSGSAQLKHFCDFGNIDWYGVDISARGIKECRDMGYKMCRCDIDEEPLPFDDEAFDVVVGSHVLEHLCDRESAVKEMGRVLKAGGLLIIGVPIKPFPGNHLLSLYYSLKTIPKGGTRWAVDLASLMSFLRRSLDSGYEVVDVRGFRLVSARRRTNWENHESFYKLNVRLGKLCPSLAREVNVVMRKRAASPRRTARGGARRSRASGDA
jgi:SAM-dependent methyltransferase